MKEIDIGNESFQDFINNDSYYVDKTLFVKTIFKKGTSKVLLITRPRRFGKTLTMDTFYEFLRINPSDPNNVEDTSYQQKLFKDTKIFEDTEFCQEYMGKFPVIFVSFKNIYGQDFKSAYEQLGSTIFDLASKYAYVIENKNQKLSALEINKFKKCLDEDLLCDLNNSNIVKNSLTTLTEVLSTYHGVKPILLIDEYDVPIAKAAARGYYDEMIGVISVLLSKALKTNPHLGKAVLTGCLRAAKESIFTGLNNLKVCSILDDGNRSLSEGIGFTKEETFEVLDYYKLDKYSDMVTDNYDGYYFGDVHMYCPWDVMNFCDANYQKVDREDARIAAGNYWINSSGNDVIEEFMGYIKPENIGQMQNLVDGKTITSSIRTSLCYGDLKHHAIEDFWTLLLYTGYLTFEPKSLRYDDNAAGEYVCNLYIPNNEIKRCFRSKILDFYKHDTNTQNYTIELVKGLFSGNGETVEANINELLKKYVSIRDFATNAPKENYYHGFMNGLLVNGSSIIQEQSSNLESGNGYVDILVKSTINNAVAVIELKQISNELQSKVLKAREAIKQIKANNYAEMFLSNPDIKNVYIYGICFCKKECSVKIEKLK